MPLDSFKFIEQKDKNAWFVYLYIQPKAKKTEVSGEYGSALKLRVQAPPVDNKANTAVSEFLSKKLGLPKKAVNIYKGNKGKEKVFVVESRQEPEWSALFE